MELDKSNPYTALNQFDNLTQIGRPTSQTIQTRQTSPTNPTGPTGLTGLMSDLGLKAIGIHLFIFLFHLGGNIL